MLSRQKGMALLLWCAVAALLLGVWYSFRAERPSVISPVAAPQSGSAEPTNEAARARPSARIPPLRQAPMPLGPPEADENSPRKALARAFRIKDPVERSMQVGRLMADFFARDPEAALDYLHTMPRGAEFNNALFFMLGAIAENDAARAIGLASELATHAEERVVFNVLFDAFARRDVREAVRYLSLVPAGEGRINALRATASRWADKNLEAALTWAQGLSDPEDRDPAMETVLWSLAVEDPWRALDLAARTLDADPLERTVARIMQRIGDLDSQKASEVLKLLPSGPTQTHIALDLARSFASDSPTSALAWVATLSASEMRTLALNNILDVWIETAPLEAADYVSRMAAGAEQIVAARHFAERYGSLNPQDAVRWAQSLHSETARNEAVVGAVNGWAQQDAAAAARWAGELPSQHPARFESVRSAVSYWRLSDLQEARAFARDLSPEALRKAALDELGD
ncbi:MAG: hypothetical protein M9910_07490 [Kiritimatiellae bacterium]|nr:hypothetical protein [Kiritimatiellia bacterium]